MNKQCTKCMKKKHLSMFYRDKSKKDGFEYECKSCRYTPKLIKSYRAWNKGLKGYAGIGSKHFNFKGGKNISVQGYIRVLIEGKMSYQQEHRKIMEEFLGRKLKPTEEIHHINGNKLDNQLDNLLLISRSEHHKIHDQFRQRDNLGRYIRG